MGALRATPIARAAGLAAALALLFAAAPVVAEAVELEEERERVEEEREEGEGKERRWHVRGRADLLELLSPRAGDRFAAGETVTLAWRAGATFAEEEGRVEEWEAFLSLDGGRRYPIRLTPHLDLERRSFAIRLPAQPTKEARLLIRLGDERRELEFELPWTFEIAAAETAAGTPLRTFAAGRGEAPRGGEQGVVSWVEGDRDGGRLHTVEAPPRDPSWQSVDAGWMFELAAVAPASRIPSLPLSALFSHPENGTKAPPRPQLAESAPADLEPRTQTCRINE